MASDGLLVYSLYLNKSEVDIQPPSHGAIRGNLRLIRHCVIAGDLDTP